MGFSVEEAPRLNALVLLFAVFRHDGLSVVEVVPR
jgi:hypothetical protein